MANEPLMEFGDDDFQARVVKSQRPVLVEFWAPWCGPCKALVPALEAAAASFAGRATVGKLNTEEHRQVSEALGIRALPTMLVFKGGRVVDQQVGAVPRARLESMLCRALEP